ncbi:MAG: YaiI/YqxD family protein [Oscillospiraceae bacterium]
MQILIDADGCPVFDLAITLAGKYKLQCTLICDTSHVFNREGARTITVSKGADSADFALVNMVQKGDIIVTQDYGLAAMCLAKKGLPISQNGLVYSDDNIDALLNQRHTAKKIRMAGGRLHGAAKRTQEENTAFCEKLEQLLKSLIS